MLTNKKVMAGLMAACLLTSVTALAHEPGAYSKEALRRGHDKPLVVTEAPVVQIQEILHHGQDFMQDRIAVKGAVSAFIAGNTYRMTDENNVSLVVDLGKYGGKLIGRTPFVALGKVMEGSEGLYLAADEVIWRDFNPYEDYFNSWYKAQGKAAAPAIKVENDRDAAYFHPPIESENKRFLLDNPAKLTEADYAAYAAVPVAEVTGGRYPVGTKVAVTGRNVATYGDDTMTFWDRQMHEVRIRMNGAYAPLGQRGTFYGTVQKNDQGYYVSLDCMESIE